MLSRTFTKSTGFFTTGRLSFGISFLAASPAAFSVFFSAAFRALPLSLPFAFFFLTVRAPLEERRLGAA
jgi:hypothetical protein